MEAGLREVRPKRSGVAYQPRDIFPEADRYRREQDLTAYVSQRLVELARADALYITDIFNQSARVREAAGMIILGQRWDYDHSPKTMVVDPYNVTPEEIVNYRVKVRALNGKPISWKKGMAGQGKSRQWRWTGQGSAAIGKVDIAEDVWLTSDKTELTLPVHYAWNCLRQCGKYCARAKTTEDQNTIWTVEELKPAGYEADQPAPEEPRRRRTLPQ